MATTKTTQAAIEAAQPRKRIQLSTVASKAKLISLVIDSDATYESLGAELEFFVRDRYPLNEFLDLMSLAEKAQDNPGIQMEVIDRVLPLILNEDGSQMLTDDIDLDPMVALEAVHKVMEYLGNLSARNLTGNRQK